MQHEKPTEHISYGKQMEHRNKKVIYWVLAISKPCLEQKGLARNDRTRLTECCRKDLLGLSGSYGTFGTYIAYGTYPAGTGHQTDVVPQRRGMLHFV